MVIGDHLFSFGSGSSAKRERVLVAPIHSLEKLQLVDAHTLYAAFRACTAFSGSELNIEGVAVDVRPAIELSQVIVCIASALVRALIGWI